MNSAYTMASARLDDKFHVPNICLQFLHNKCNSTVCTKIHTEFPYQWQIEYEGRWLNFSEFHSKEIEEAYRTVISNGIVLTSCDPSTSEMFFDPEEMWYVDFDKKILKRAHPYLHCNIRRLSTPTRSVIDDTMATHFVWYYRDFETREWTPFDGSDSSSSILAYLFTKSSNNTKSDEIERDYMSKNWRFIEVFLGNRQFWIDTEEMNMDDERTKETVPCRRRVKQTPLGINKGSTIGLQAIASLNFKDLGDVSPLKIETISVKDSHEWYFQDEQEEWIKYGQQNSLEMDDHVVTVSSDDIDEKFHSNPNLCMGINSSLHEYVLDFIKLTQTNKKTGKVRPIRRKLKEGSSTRTDIGRSTAKFVCEWYINTPENEWIMYDDFTTSIRSSDIEEHFAKHPQIPLQVVLGKVKYSLDFVKFTQTNTVNGNERPIQRAKKIISYGPPKKPISFESNENKPTELPSHWSSMDNRRHHVMKVLLNSSGGEYGQIEQLIKSSGSSLRLARIYRIQNPYLWRAMRDRTDYSKKRFPNTKFTERFLFHGTESINCDSICEENLDWRLHGTRVGAAYGQGAYFTNNASYAATFASGDPHRIFVMRVLIGNWKKGDYGDQKILQNKSGHSYDTSVDDVEKPTIFVKYDSQEYYPEYVCEFNSVK